VFNGIITGMVMPGGFHFPQKLTSGQIVRIEGQGYEELERRVLEFRLRQGSLVDPSGCDLEVVRADLKNYICTNFPRNCTQTPRAAPAPTDAPIIRRPFYPNIQRLSEWYARVAYRSLQFVDAAEANRRAAICAGCPQNCDFVGGCAPCNHQIERNALMVLGGRRVQNEPDLKACRVFGHHLPAAVWMRDPYSEPSHEVPSFCWKRPAA
jgi:hypothetical protein